MPARSFPMLALSIVALCLGWPADGRAGVVLITTEEAQLPPPIEVASSRGITRAPRIELSPESRGSLRSPFHFRLRFKAFGGAAIDLGSVEVTYRRSTDIDLTRRVRQFIRPGGIDITEAEAPPGEHLIRVQLRDSEGRQASSNFILAVVDEQPAR